MPLAPIPGYEGDGILTAIRQGQIRPIPELAAFNYYACGQGRIYSLNRHPPREIQSQVGPYNYRCVCLHVYNAWVRYYVADLVAYTFLGPKPHVQAIAVHNNGDTHDDRPENLRWGYIADIAQTRRGLGAKRQAQARPGIVPAELPEHQVQSEVLVSTQSQRLMEALRPFAQLHLPEGLSLSSPKQALLTVNRHRPTEATLNLQHFLAARRAHRIMVHGGAGACLDIRNAVLQLSDALRPFASFHLPDEVDARDRHHVLLTTNADTPFESTLCVEHILVARKALSAL